MATLGTILDVETEVERAFRVYLTAPPLNLTVIGSDSGQVLNTARFDLVATKIEEGQHQVPIGGTGPYAGRAIYDQFRIRVQFDFVYAPDFNQGQGGLRGRLRTGLSDFYGIQARFNSPNAFLYLAPTTLRQIDGQRFVDDERKEEHMSLTLEAVFFLNQATLALAT